MPRTSNLLLVLVDVNHHIGRYSAESIRHAHKYLRVVLLVDRVQRAVFLLVLEAVCHGLSVQAKITSTVIVTATAVMFRILILLYGRELPDNQTRRMARI